MAPPYPNPAFGAVTFVLSSASPADWASLRLYNALGQQVAVPFEGTLQAGEYAIRYEGGHLPAGVYVYVLQSAGHRLSGYLVMTH